MLFSVNVPAVSVTAAGWPLSILSAASLNSHNTVANLRVWPIYLFT